MATTLNPIRSPALIPDPKRGLFTITDLVTLPVIQISGRSYGLKTREALTLREDATVQVMLRRLIELEEAPFNQAVAQELGAIRDRICRVIVTGMYDIWLMSWLPRLFVIWISKWLPSHQALTDYQREEIVLAFCVLRWGGVAATTAPAGAPVTAIPLHEPSTPPNSSQSSPGSTPGSTGGNG